MFKKPRILPKNLKTSPFPIQEAQAHGQKGRITLNPVGETTRRNYKNM
jgi:hypothetical protein